MSNPNAGARDSQVTKRGLWVWAVTVASFSAIGHAISADSWGWRSALVGAFGFVVSTLVARGLAGIWNRANPEAKLTWRAGISRGWRWFSVFGLGVVAGLIQTIGAHHPWRATATRVMILAVIWTLLYVGVTVFRRDPVAEIVGERSDGGSE